MASSEDRSLSGIPISKLMRSRINDKFDLDQSTFSPTESEDNFRYFFGQHIKVNTESDKPLEVNNTIASASTSTAKISNHTPPCQKYLQSSSDTIITKAKDGKIKPNGIDDGFKGEASKCGSSLIRVAQQMVSGRGLSSLSIEMNDDCDPDLKYFDPHKRRGSRSLPASPIVSPSTSPKSRRRVNKYFTGAYTDKEKGSWILSNLLARRTMSQSVDQISEETKDDIDHHLDLNEPKQLKEKSFKAKPSEFREMNFWSPTSM